VKLRGFHVIFRRDEGGVAFCCCCCSYSSCCRGVGREEEGGIRCNESYVDGSKGDGCMVAAGVWGFNKVTAGGRGHPPLLLLLLLQLRGLGVWVWCARMCFLVPLSRGVIFVGSRGCPKP
jgi:hypothetical protein